MLSSCENIGTCAATMTGANLLLFTVFSYVWEQKLETKRGSLVAFSVFMTTFAMFILSSVLAALGNPFCQIVFCMACCLDVPAVLSIWIFIFRHQKVCGNLESKVSQN